MIRSSAVSLALGYVALGIAALVLFAAPLWYAWQVTIQEGRAEILQADARAIAIEKMELVSSRLRDAVARYDLELLASLLRESVPEFSPADAPADAPSTTVVAFPARHSRKI